MLELSETGGQGGPASVPDGSTEASSSGEAAEDAKPASSSRVKSLTYGILGLDCPDRPKVEPGNASYTKGQWVGAAGKMAAIFKFLL